MPSLRAIKSAIFKTECKNCIMEGLCSSEPILSMGESGLIDNYFIYACDDDETVYSKPLVIFGVYSDIPQKAYIENNCSIEDKKYTAESKLERNVLLSAYKAYTEVYPSVRDFAFKDCSELQKNQLNTYIMNLKTISGTVLWEFYMKLFPDFFEWAARQQVTF